jgi:uncharacterized protein YeaO (DUF488 family)
MTIKIKRVYDDPEAEDGLRILVDRLWPRGLTKEKAKIDLWVKEPAPSNDLRKWYGHDPGKWENFKEKYFAELDGRREAVRDLVQAIGRKPAALLYSSKETQLNNAEALKIYLKEKL